MTENASDKNQKSLGWCPMEQNFIKTPVYCIGDCYDSTEINSGGGEKKNFRIKNGVIIAKKSIQTLFQNKKLFWFSFIAGLIILAMFVLEINLMSLADSHTYWTLGYLQGLLFTFSIELLAFSAINLLLADLLINLSLAKTKGYVDLKLSLSVLKSHFYQVFGWSFIIALAGTALYTVLTHSHLYTHIYPWFASVLYIPFIYYIPDIVLSAQNHIFIKIIISSALFLMTLFTIPGIVLENKNIISALLSSFSVFRKALIEIFGCFLIFGVILFLISLPEFFISLTPALVGYDYHFFSVHHFEMTTVCIIFLIGWWVFITSVFTVLGIAVHKIHYYCKTGIIE